MPKKFQNMAQREDPTNAQQEKTKESPGFSTAALGGGFRLLREYPVIIKY